MVRKTLINYSKKSKFDDFKTPEKAIYPLLRYTRKCVVWECAGQKDSNIAKVFKTFGYDVVCTDIKDGFDFLSDEPDFHFDIIVTNPPYSLKDKFLERAYLYNKPFAFLMPLTTLEGIKRNKLFKQYGISVLVLAKRINFMGDVGKKSCWFNTSWFMYNIVDNNKLIFE